MPDIVAIMGQLEVAIDIQAGGRQVALEGAQREMIHIYADNRNINQEITRITGATNILHFLTIRLWRGLLCKNVAGNPPRLGPVHRRDLANVGI